MTIAVDKITRSDTPERKLRVFGYDPERPALNIFANRKKSTAITAAGRPVINANFPGPSAMFGSNIASSATTNTPSATSIPKIITPNRIAKITNARPQFTKVVKVMIAETGVSIRYVNRSTIGSCGRTPYQITVL